MLPTAWGIGHPLWPQHNTNLSHLKSLPSARLILPGLWGSSRYCPSSEGTHIITLLGPYLHVHFSRTRLDSILITFKVDNV